MSNRAIALVMILACYAHAEFLTFDSQESWEANWSLKPQLNVFTPEGHLGLIKFHKDINAALDAHLFVHPTNERGDVAGGIWSALSNPNAAPRIIDGDAATFWQPAGSDPLDKWIVQIDLGRAVLAKEIRIHFPDEEGAKPFRQFSVFASTGAHVAALEDVYRFAPIYRTTKPNLDTYVSFGFKPAVEDTTRAVEQLSAAGGSADFTAPEFTGDANTATTGGRNKIVATGQTDSRVATNSNWQMIQFIRFLVDEHQLDGALAEIEVITVGDNISLGVEEKGGTYINGSRATDPFFWLDGNLNTYGVIEVHQQFTESRGTALEGGLWWQVDLGATYWVDDAFVYWQKAGERLADFRLGTNNAGTGYTFFSSDGTKTLSGDIDFDTWIFEPEWTNAREQYKRHYRYLFNPRKVRHIFWLALHDLGWRAHPMELQMFSPGHPAEVVIQSNFLDLSALAGDGQPKVIKAIHYDADLPPNTQIELRSRSGNEMGEVYTFHNKIGEVVTEEKWNSSPKVLRGRVDTSVVVGEAWSEWSNVYKLSGEPFKSDSPRKFVQLELVMSTEDPAVAPTVRSVELEFVDALVNEAHGSILPRQAKPNEDTRFTYMLWPSVTADNKGFDRLRLVVPDLVRADEVEVTVAGQVVAPTAMNIAADSLLIDLPQVVQGDSVQVAFTTRLVRNAAVVDADLGLSDAPGLWQDVEPAERRSNVVLLPELADSDRLIGDLQLSSRVLTPNGDGVNDAVELSFVVFKAQDAVPMVEVRDLVGRPVAQLTPVAEGPTRRFTWNGQDVAGATVPPGIYLWRIDVNADSGDAIELRVVEVAY